jgi:hypothetical protein
VTLDAGAYQVAETGPSGYDVTFSTGCAGTIDVGDTATCTIVNDDVIPPRIALGDNSGRRIAGIAGLTYRGRAPGARRFVLSVSPTGRTVTFSLTCGSVRITLARLHVRNGTFSAERRQAGSRHPLVARVNGRFVTPRMAKGTFRAPACGSRQGTWTVSRV